MPPVGLSTRARRQNTTPLLPELHWLCVLERIQFRLCVLAYHCVRGTTPAYPSDSLRPTSEIVSCRCLHSADTTTLQVPSTRRATLDDRAFSVAAARARNSLPVETRACSSLSTFQRETKSHLFVSQTADVAPSTPMVSRHLSALSCVMPGFMNSG